jgi:sugar phosphate isomerase/epimerase
MSTREQPDGGVAPITRREALARLGAAAALGSVVLPGMSCRGLSAHGLQTIGLQLYTVRKEMERSVEQTLARVAEIGYKEVELAGLFQRTPAQFAAMLKANDLTAPAAHLGLDVMRTAWDQALDDAATLGHRYVLVAWVPPEERSSVDAARKLGEDFNRAGEAARKRGLAFAYHNHDFEFAPLGSTTCYDVLLATCDPALVSFELDLFWITKAGKDPVAYLTRYPGRFPMVHVKDMTADGTMVDVGKGTIDFAKIFAVADGGIKHYFVEHDNPPDPFASIAASYRALQAL